MSNSVSVVELWHLGRAWPCPGIPGRVPGAAGDSGGSGQGLLVATALWEGREGGRDQLCLPVR